MVVTMVTIHGSFVHRLTQCTTVGQLLSTCAIALFPGQEKKGGIAQEMHYLKCLSVTNLSLEKLCRSFN